MLASSRNHLCFQHITCDTIARCVYFGQFESRSILHTVKKHYTIVDYELHTRLES